MLTQELLMNIKHLLVSITLFILATSPKIFTAEEVPSREETSQVISKLQSLCESNLQWLDNMISWLEDDQALNGYLNTLEEKQGRQIVSMGKKIKKWLIYISTSKLFLFL